ncbi:alpha/beta fold hydrolase [Ramlibacter sp.]|uniref:alpha/beta fold hydrolase n=1 Tax=Ramlibacter sp. TaxID=1917967 RepID=UPI00261451D4|nr:alpha/beta fold hydrolase [Ramlibacter sp.]
MPTASSLARRLQLSWAALCLAAALWLAWRWPHSPLLAFAGAALVLALPSLILALELCIASSLARSDTTVPRASGTQLIRAWISEVRHFHHTFAWRQPFRWREVEDHLDAGCEGRVGVVLVHGFVCNRGFWTPWLRRLRSAGHPCLAMNLEPVYGSIDSYAEQIDAAVRRMTKVTGRAPVLVCHSMGGLAARAWWRASGGRTAVAHLVTIASPHRGTWVARFSHKVNGRQMRLKSAWIAALQTDELRHPLPPTTCWYSNCDNVVFPSSTATLGGADNRFLPGEAHVALAFHPAVHDACVQLLHREQSSRQGEFVTGIGAENG